MSYVQAHVEGFDHKFAVDSGAVRFTVEGFELFLKNAVKRADYIEGQPGDEITLPVDVFSSVFEGVTLEVISQ